MNEASRQYKKIFFGINQSNDIFTGKNFNKYTFLEALTPYLSVIFLPSWAEKEFNRPKRVFTIGPDYQWGWNNVTSGGGIPKRGAARSSGKSSIRSSKEDYTAFMQPILDAKPDLARRGQLRRRAGAVPQAGRRLRRCRKRSKIC